MHQPKQSHTLPKRQVLTSALVFFIRAVTAQWIADLNFKVFIDNVMTIAAKEIWLGCCKKAGRLQFKNSSAENKISTPSTLTGVKHWAAVLSSPLSRHICSDSQVARSQCTASFQKGGLGMTCMQLSTREAVSSLSFWLHGLLRTRDLKQMEPA